MYRCNKADDPRCPSCQHKEPHERWSINVLMSRAKDVCTTWADCNDGEGKFLFKVRCMKVK